METKKKQEENALRVGKKRKERLQKGLCMSIMGARYRKVGKEQRTINETAKKRRSEMEEIKKQARQAAEELVAAAKLERGQLVVIGCSSSEVGGSRIGSDSSPVIADAIYAGLSEVFDSYGIYIAAQCCEHLNRALIVEREAVPYAERVNVVPQPKAGGSFATAAYREMKHPIAVEELRADAGLDIGGTLIGMHLKKVAVPVRLSVKQIGEATLLAARTRAKFVGGSRAAYDEDLL